MNRHLIAWLLVCLPLLTIAQDLDPVRSLIKSDNLDSAFLLTDQILSRKLTSVEKAHALRMRAWLLTRQSKDPQAIPDYFNAYQLFIKCDEPNEAADVLNRLGILYYRNNAYNQSLEYYNLAFSFVEDEESILAAHLVHNKGLAFKASGKLDSALYYFWKSSKRYELLAGESKRFEKKQAESMLEIANVYFMMKDYSESISVLQGLLFMDLHDTKIKSKILNNIGNAQLQLGKLEAAKKSLKQSLALKDKVNDVRLFQTTYYNLAQVAESEGKMDEAIEWYARSIDLYDNAYDTQQLMDSYTRLIAILSESDDSKLLQKYASMMNRTMVPLINKTSDLENIAQRDKVLAMQLKINYEQEREKQSKKIQWLIFSGVIIMLASILICLMSYHLRKKLKRVSEKNKLISYQAQKVDERNAYYETIIQRHNDLIS